MSIDLFLASKSFAVAGASTKRDKYGNKVFRSLVEAGFPVHPLNPTAKEVEGVRAFSALAELPEVPEALSIVTPPHATREIIASAIELGVKHVWMQPGAEDETASLQAREAGLNVIDDGSCILVALATRR